MNETEARQAIGVLTAYYPRDEVPASTVAAWSAALADYDVRDAIGAANVLGADRRFLPSLAEWLVEVRAVRRDRWQREEARALPEGGYISLAEWRERQGREAHGDGEAAADGGHDAG